VVEVVEIDVNLFVGGWWDVGGEGMLRDRLSLSADGSLTVLKLTQSGCQVKGVSQLACRDIEAREIVGE